MNKSLDHIHNKLFLLLESVGDMSLKRRAIKIIEGLRLKNGDKIIDIGCGDGYYLHLLSKLPVKISVTGLDNSEISLSDAKKNLNSKYIKLISATALEMPFKKNTFDKAILTEVLEHIVDDKKVLLEAYRILKHNGLLILTVPSYDFPFLWDPLNWILQHFFNTHISGDGFFAGTWAKHMRLYKKDELIKLFINTGFKIEEKKELTTRALPFNHYLVNLVARFLINLKPPTKLSDPINKFKNVKKPLVIKIAFFLVNRFDKLNDIFPGRTGLNIYIKARK